MKADKDNLDVYHQIDLYIEERRSEVKPVTINVINMMKIHLQNFGSEQMTRQRTREEHPGTDA